MPFIAARAAVARGAGGGESNNPLQLTDHTGLDPWEDVLDFVLHKTVAPNVAAYGGMYDALTFGLLGDLLRPGGVTIGKAGTDDTIREITGGLDEAQAMFQQLSHGGTIVSQTPKLTRVELPNGGGFVQLRTLMTRSPNTAATIDVNVPGSASGS